MVYILLNSVIRLNNNKKKDTMKSDNELLEIAIDKAKKVVHKNKTTGRYAPTIVAMAYDSSHNLLACRTNSYVKTHPRQKHYAVLAGKPDKIFLHAEISALVSTRSQVDILVVARVNSGTLEPECAKPCPICQLAIVDYNITRVIFSEKKEMFDDV